MTHVACSVDMVLVGAEGVVENGGIINKLGTYTIALAAAAHQTPMYVAAESYKFARLYPLNQRDYPLERKPMDFGALMPRGAKVENPSRDYTPPSEHPPIRQFRALCPPRSWWREGKWLLAAPRLEAATGYEECHVSFRYVSEK